MAVAVAVALADAASAADAGRANVIASRQQRKNSRLLRENKGCLQRDGRTASKRGRQETPLPARRKGCLDVPTGYGVEMPLPHTRGMSRHSPGVASVAFLPVVADHDDFRFMLRRKQSSPLAGFARCGKEGVFKRYTDFAAESFIFYDRRSACGVGDHELGHG